MIGQSDPVTYKTIKARGGAHSTMDSVLALHPAAPGLILGVPEDFPMEISFDVAEIYQQQCTA